MDIYTGAQPLEFQESRGQLIGSILLGQLTLTVARDIRAVTSS